MQNYIQLNKEAWNQKTPVHIDSAFYDMPSFLAGKNTLNAIELELLGDIKGKSVLHLQCHFGQDTISLSRMGAKATGVDLSDAAIAKATELAASLHVDTKFICCNVYDLADHLNEQFDLVFTSYGTIGWLPDLDKWAAIVNRYLTPGGKFIMADFHPVVWMYDNDFTKVEYRYFKDEAIVEELPGTYADREAAIKNTTVSWNHSLSELLQSLINNGLQLTQFREYDYSPYNCLSGMEEQEPGKFRIKIFGNKIPIIYALTAQKF
ncbi:MAG: class I SAM-dependent methyltransferase [Ferruginibacter sp.]